MRITPIINNLNLIKTQNGNRSETAYSTVLKLPVAADTITFSSKQTPEDIKRLKKLLEYKIPDMYSGKIMIAPAELEKILQKKVFSRPLNKIVPLLREYKTSLFPIEQEIVTLLEKDAKKYPTIKLEDAIHMRTMQAMIDLRQTQQPIFQALIEAAKNLPPDKQVEFKTLMDTTRHRLYNQPTLIPYSAKEFRYKLSRIEAGIQSRGIPSELKTMRKLKNIASCLPEKTVKTLSPKQRASSRIKLYPKTNINYINGLIQQMSKVLESSPLKRDKELNDLFNATKMRIYNIPIIAPFSRKSFLYELKKITRSIDDTRLAREMEKIAVQLPTSKENVSAFIMHSATHSSEKIGYDIFCGSVGTAEHLLPSLHGGSNYIDNLGLATSFLNSERGHRHMDTQLRKHPEIYENAQKYVNRLIELYNDGTFKKLGIDKSYILSFVSKMRKMAPAEHPLILDTSKLI